MNLKTPYLLEVWDEKYVFAPTDGSAPHWEEKMLAVLGADTMEFEGRAYNISLTTDIYGEVKLGFSLDNYYYNTKTGEKEINYLAKYVFNEAKVKLKYKGEWYEFVIKNTQETHNERLTCVYTCQQLASYELSKIGYNVSFTLDDKRGSAVQDASSFMEEILEDTEWAFAPAGEIGDSQGYTGETFATNLKADLVETSEEILYYFPITAKLTVHPFHFQKGQLIEEAGKQVSITGYYLPYSQIDSTESKIFAYIDDGTMAKERHLSKEKLVLMPRRKATPKRPTQWTAEVPKKSKYSVFISYTDYKQPANSIQQYCNQYTRSTGEIGYYRDITRNLDYGYTKTTDPAPAMRTFAEETNLIGGDIYCTYKDTDAGVTLTYLKFHPAKYREGDTFDIYKSGSTYKVIHNGDVNNQLTCTIVGKDDGVKMLSAAKKTYFLRSLTYDGAIIYTPYTNLTSFTWGGHTKDDWYSCTITGDDVKDLSNSVSSIRQYFTVEEKKSREISSITIKGYSGTDELAYYEEDASGSYYFDNKTGKYVNTYVSGSKRYARRAVNETYSYNKYRTMEASKSNCFNLTQTVAETFEVWCRYYIKHNEDGTIARDPKTGRRLKWVSLVSNYGVPNQVGFTYGVNVSGIQRTVETTSLATKLYVDYCENGATKDGVITIQKAKDNLSKENFIFNFDYFIQMKLLDAQSVSLDFYNIETGDIDFFTTKAYFEGNKKGPGYLRFLGMLNAEYDMIYDTILGSGESSLTNQLVQYKTLYDAYNVACATDGMALSGTETDDLEVRRAQDASMRDNYKALMDKTQTQIDFYTEYLDKLMARKQELNKAFAQKYQRFIQEGNWADSNYINHDSYYNDALKVSADAAKPSVSYIINIVDLSVLPGYELYDYKVGDQTWVEDVDYFGYDDNKKPYHEAVVVKEISYSLDDPTQTTITIANQSSKFEDLFQKLTATVNSYQMNQQTYNRASNITTSGSLEYSSLQESFNQNKALTLTNNDVVTNDNYGITVKNASNPNDIVRIVSGGIVLSNDGGATYTTGIYAGQLNTKLIKAGEINTELLKIGTTNTNGYLYFEGDTIKAHSVVGNSIITISPTGMVLKKGDTNIFNFDSNGDLTLSGSIIGGQNTTSISPRYYMGIQDIKKACTVGPAFVRTADKTKLNSKTYYYLTSGYITLEDINNLNDSQKIYYSFSEENYEYTGSGYKPTNDSAYVSGKTYYIKSGNTFVKATFSTTDPKFEEGVTYYETTTEKKYYPTTATTPTNSIYKLYSRYTQLVGDFVTGTIYYERQSANEAKKDWRLLLGESSDTHNFGVDSKGQLYASQAVFSGNVYADGGVFNNVVIRNTCTVAGEAITGNIGGSSRLDYGNVLDLNNEFGQIGQGWNAITIGENGEINIPYSNNCGSANYSVNAGYASSANSAETAGYANSCNRASYAFSAGRTTTYSFLDGNKNTVYITCMVPVPED